MTFASLSFRRLVPTSISAQPASRGLWLKLVVLALALLAGGSQAHAQGQPDQCVDVSANDGGPTSGNDVLYLYAGDVISGSIYGTDSLFIQQDFGFPDFVLATNSIGPFSVTITTSGNYYFSWTTKNYTIACNPPQTTFTVTTTADDATGVAANCATGSTTACTLRDALAAAAASSSTGLTVNFSPTAFPATNTAAQNTITLGSGGVLNVPNNTTIQGLTSGSGASLQNLVTVSGNNTTNIFFLQSGTAAAINNLTMTAGYCQGGSNGGAIDNFGTLTLNQDAISNNQCSGYGGGIFNDGPLTITNSTISGNKNTVSNGGGIYQYVLGTLTISNSTITGNTTTGNGGGIYLDAGSATLTQVTIVGNSATGNAGGIYAATVTPTINATIVGANSAANYADIQGSYSNPAGDDVVSNFSNGTSPSSLSSLGLAPLGYYGGPTQTMPLLPGSRNLCSVSLNSTTDQRGVIRTTNYFGITCDDPGATNSNYSIAFTTQPSATYNVGVNFSTTPVVSIEDDGYVLPYTSTGGSVSFSDSLSLLAGTKTGDFSAGTVTPTGAYVSQTATNDTLTAKYNLTVDGSHLGYLSATSSSFAVVSPLTAFTISTLSGVTAGTSQSVTVTALNGSSTATSYTGTVTFSSTDTAAGLPASYTFTGTDAGVHTFTNGVTFKTAGTSQTITVADTSANVSKTSNAVAVTAASAASISAASGSGKSATIGSAFTLPLQVQVLDAYSNAISGNVVTFTAPTTGASASLSASTCTTDTTGKCSVTATANGTASTTAYSVTAKATGVTTGATFTLTNTAVTPTLTVTASPTTLVYGQPVTITATSVPASAGGSYPTGAVTFYDNTTTLTPTSTPSSGVSTFSTYALTGAQTYGASTAADTNFNAVAKTTATAITVSKATPTLALSSTATSPVLVIYGTTGSIPITVTLPYTPTAVSFVGPSGGLSYTITPTAGGSAVATGTTGAISGGGASIPVANTLATGTYNVVVGYAGDANFTSATNITVSLQVGQITPTVTYPAQTAITYGTALTANLNATTAYSGTSLTSGGTTTYTATLGTGSPVAVTTATVLAAGTYTLTATWTPNSTNAATYKTASGSTTLVVNPAKLTVTANPITITYGQTLPAYAATITGYVNGDTSSVVSGAASLSTTPATPTNVGTYTITPSLGTLAATNYTFTYTTGTLTINKASVLVTLAQSAPLPTANGTGVGVPTTFTVSVTDATANSTGTPTGQVLLLSGGTQIGTGTLSGGTVSIPNITFSAPQTASLTAQYVTDGNFAGNTSNTLSEVVVTPSLSISSNPGSLSIMQGTAGTTTLTFVAVGNYTGTAAPSCSGLPANTTCVFGSPTLTFAGNDATLTSALSVVTTSPSFQAKGGTLQGGLWWMPAVLLALLLRRRRKMSGALLLLVLGFTMMTLTGCGGSTSLYNTGTPKGSANVTVTIAATATGAGSSNLTTSVTLPVNVY